MRGRVHPLHSTENGRRSLDDLDAVVQDVEDEIAAVTAVTDREIRDLYGGGSFDFSAGNDHVSSHNQRGLVSTAKNGTPSSGHGSAPRTHTGIQIRSSHEIPGSGYGGITPAVLDEEVLLSHQLPDSEEKVASELAEQFNALKKQIAEYQNRYAAANEKLKNSEAKNAELERKYVDLEDDYTNLKLQRDAAPLDRVNSPSTGALGPVSLLSAKNLLVHHQTSSGRKQADLQKRSEQIRKALLAEENDDDVELSLSSSGSDSTGSIYGRLKRWIMFYLPFKRDIRNIQARFGSSVAAYFIFHRLVYIQFCFLTLVMLLFFGLHLFEMTRNGKGNSTVQDFLSGGGYLPRFMQLSTYATDEKLEYSITVIFPIIFMVFFLSLKLTTEHKTAITFDAIENENDTRFSKELLCSWDFSTFKKAEVEDLVGHQGNKYLQMLEETHNQGIIKARTKVQTFIIYSRRALGLFLYLLVSVASFTAIIYITINSSNISNQASRIGGLNNIGVLVAPLSLTIINFAVPKLLELISIVEHWDTAETELNFLLLREFISSTLNSVILAYSYLLLIDPFLMANHPSLRRSLELKFSDNFRCRFDQAADGLFVLVGFTWAFELVGALGEPISSFILSKIMGKPWKKPEFKVADSMVKKLSFLGLVYVSLPIAPLSIIFVPVYLFVWFKWEKYCIKHYFNKPRRRFRGTRARLAFIFFYLLTYVLLGMTVAGYILTSKTLPKACHIQDDYIEMCEDGVGDIGTDVCTTDKNNKFYDMWGKDNNYPKDICRNACGPFINERSFAAPFKDLITGTLGLDTAWRVLFQFPYIPWALVILLSLGIVIRTNMNEVMKLAAYYKDRAWEAQIQGSEMERRRQERIIKKLKSIEDVRGDGGGDADSDDDDNDNEDGGFNGGAVASKGVQDSKEVGVVRAFSSTAQQLQQHSGPGFSGAARSSSSAAGPNRDELLTVIHQLERKSMRMEPAPNY